MSSNNVGDLLQANIKLNLATSGPSDIRIPVDADLTIRKIGEAPAEAAGQSED